MMRGNKEVEPFRFLDLPKELRLLVYENLPRSIKRHQTRHPDEPSHRLIFIIKSVPVAILSTCKLVYREARPLLQASANAFTRDIPPRIIDGISGRGEGRMLDALVRAIMKQVHVLHDHELGQGPCLTLSQLFEGRLRDSLSSKRNSRYLVKFVHQAGHYLKYSSMPNGATGLRAIELVKYTSTLSGIGRYWALGADLHALNSRLNPDGVAVMCAGVLPAGVAETTNRTSRDVLIPQHINFQAYGLECYVPSSRQMEESHWVEGWLE
ncbi:hypothetical protein P171DRAFT_145502 [Karstenula rhodostoma CBS 690.94]|uniref:F-box domain-containing protein n=1 Tax=Karstenula rhodostoma CBS 690.94 TaxID=1392251 RepID=A0A9P4UHK8_9PLEO|nr:hypothetical protein P171DRAFT_145502 [Karstenula rhodostoma CBS 690.94]